MKILTSVACIILMSATGVVEAGGWSLSNQGKVAEISEVGSLCHVIGVEENPNAIRTPLCTLIIVESNEHCALKFEPASDKWSKCLYIRASNTASHAAKVPIKDRKSFIKTVEISAKAFTLLVEDNPDTALRLYFNSGYNKE